MTLRLALIGLGLTLLTGCSALSSLQTASTPLETYELSALPAGSVAVPRGRRVLEIALPTATGALTSDRIVIKPTPLQIQSLPDARWIDAATEHVQLLLVRSLANSGGFALVSAAGTGPTPDYLLLTDLQAFHAEVTPEAVTVVMRTTLSLIDGQDGRVVSSRGFSTTRTVADTSAELIVPAFDDAMTQQLAEVVAWLAGVPGV
ncbi:hypothetical protein AL036_19750 [Salipiger aestuarii]|uniref:Cholesterol transport system auxiliary component n=1 Tax=Salipiger aestuarii TaxID=568098 RepID=A0A327Y343_9RHOB|nr:ABC-type transport auxiliary lipoprotein family protein [Salipiger aestuarii]EIE48991.1 ABC-type uncharacterized transport system auxiliary component-like protein [Citreicella sp. 357]KAA8605285.1 hypothetical protein AL036_19750 [Salipiger aestuarii]KAA8607513.1 hypothetical protein AL037_18675 [Salipiger aestuarii]KAB2536937.1 hypothetical protein AL035_19540 [Salipiger aestuarii]RAK15164.1 cholesterol transport system auxiliary component [Salipiger aestuarii]